MPYVEGFGTWPFGEEWLWEAIVGSYLPLLDLLDEGAPLTLSLTPVLCDQLEAPGVAERFAELRRRRSPRDPRARRRRAARGRATSSSRASSSAPGRLRARAREPARARRRPARGARARTRSGRPRRRHAILPLLASDAGVRLQVQSGVELAPPALRASWRGGFWLPECAYAPWLEQRARGRRRARRLRRADEPARARRARAPAPARQRLGRRARADRPRHDLARVERARATRPHGAYRDYHHHTVHHHNPWNNAGEAYDARRGARARARPRRRFRRAHARAAARGRRGRRAAPAGSSCARSTPSCSDTGGMRGSPGCRRSSRSARARGSRSCASTTRSSARARARACSRSCRRAAGARAGDLSTWSAPAVAEHGVRRHAPPSSSVLAAGAGVGALLSASCSRCRRATGRSWSRAGSPRPTRASASTGHRRELAAALAASATRSATAPT